MPVTPTPVTAATSRFTFYDIESLGNAFTVCAYTPRLAPEHATCPVDVLEVFFLVDDEALVEQVDPHALYTTVVTSNPGLPAVTTTLYNLRTASTNHRLATLLGLSSAPTVGDPASPSRYPLAFRPVCDTDPGYDPAVHPFLAGYNSSNYDTTMLALYLKETFPAPHNHHVLVQPATAREMRAHNDMLFSDQYRDYMPRYLKWGTPEAQIRRAMLQSGRHLDVAQLNEVQKRVGLKRLCGLLGHQIKESSKLSHNTTITTVDELYELLAYNVSDCLGLAQLFQHPVYAGNFDLKAGLLAQYSETRYARDGVTIRSDRLTIDSTSAKFVGRILAPYQALPDIEYVSFDYPHPEVAAQTGGTPVNVLAECRTFFEQNVAPDPATTPTVTEAQRAAHAQFMEVYRYYASIEGRNFNDSEEYQQRYAHPAHTLKSWPKTPNNVPYFDAYARPTACFVTFSTGGIHGAEADTQAFARDQQVFRAARRMLDRARALFPEANEFTAEAKRQHNLLCLPDGTTVDKALVLLGSDPATVRYRKPKKDNPEQAAQLTRAQMLVPDPAELLATQRPATEALTIRIDQDLHLPGGDVVPAGTVLDGKTVLATTTLSTARYREHPSVPEPVLFAPKADGSTKLHPKYVRTSAGAVVHEDFTSYYPNLLRNMRAFWNPDLGEDRYAAIFWEKERLGKAMKKPGISAEERARLSTLRNGTKLILNSASGAGDASHSTPIRMNNTIISMRILGQLFSWLIGQAQTLAGARIISTNTDGLYSVVDTSGVPGAFSEATNNRVLAEQSAAIGIEIEPEPMFLISKDSNNRLELVDPRDAPLGQVAVIDKQISTASGGTLACHGGPSPLKSLAHPAVVDFALARYLQAVAGRGEHALAEPFDPQLGRKMIEEAIDPEDPVGTLMLFQNVIAASRGSITYPFTVSPTSTPAPAGGQPVALSAQAAGEPATGDTAVASSTLDTATEAVVEQLQARNPQALPMINRVFVVRPDTPGAVNLYAAGAWLVNPASRAKREALGESRVQRNPVALGVLRAHGWDTHVSATSTTGVTALPGDQDVMVRRITNLDPSWPMVVVNDDLQALPYGLRVALIRALDLDVYVSMLDETFTGNWRNVS